jgi:hypothetical protein
MNVFALDACQRWRGRATSYRPAGEPINTRRYEVAAMPSDREARAFVVAHHYSASYPAARFRFGLYRGTDLAGVAVFSVPASQAVLRRAFPGVEPAAAVELGRFVLLDDVPANGESWFFARCREVLRREGIAGVLSHSDPVPRETSSGAVVMPGHVGTIYQASNAVYAGRASAGTIFLLPDGTVFSRRAISKIRNGERGRHYASAVLERHGAEPLGSEDPAAWLGLWLPRLTRRVRHPGNHRYLWALDRSVRLPVSLPYPKKNDRAATLLD